MKSFALAALAALAMFALLTFVGYWSGKHNADLSWSAKWSDMQAQATAGASAQVEAARLADRDTAQLWADASKAREAQAASDHATVQSLIDKVTTHAVTLPPATDCTLGPDALRLWNSANEGVDTSAGPAPIDHDPRTLQARLPDAPTP